MIPDAVGHSLRKGDAIHRQRSAGRDSMGVRAAHDQAAHPPHLLLKEAHGVLDPVRP